MSAGAKKSALLKGKALKRPFLTTFALALPAVAAIAASACGTSKPRITEGGEEGVGPGPTAPCTPSGASRECHKVVGQNNGFVDCFVGTQTCNEGAWGECGGSGTLSTRYMPYVSFASPSSNETGVRIQAGVNPLPVDASTPGSTCASDPCNPYCWTFDATPDAGPVTPVGAVANVPPNGTAICPPAATAVGNACTTNRDCFQDTHCDSGTGQCVWNISSGYTDATCAGFDLTINAWCPSTGGANPPPATYTICNRGTQPLSPVAGATTRLEVWQSNGGPSGNASQCVTPFGAPSVASTYSGTLSATLAPGACTTIDSNGVNGNRHTFLYATRALTTSTTSGNGVTPISYTTTVPHGLKTGDVVTVTGITGNTNANGANRVITVTGPSTFTTAGTGNGAYGGTGAIKASLTECNAGSNGGCFNNESSAKDNGACGTCGSAGGGSTTIVSSPYHAVCPTPDTRPEWAFLLYDTTLGGGDVKFEIRTAPDVSGAPGTYSPYITAANPPLAAQPWIRTLANPVGLSRPVPPALLPIGGVLGGLPKTMHEWLQIQITVTGAGAPPAPILNSWAVTYSCVPYE